MSQTPSPSDRLMHKTIGLAVATLGHGLYLVVRYLRDGHVNEISLGVLVFLGATTSVLGLVVVIMKRAETRSRQDRWFADRG